MSPKTGEEVARRLATRLSEIHDTGAQKQIIRKALFRVVGRKQGRIILARLHWRASTGWTQLLYLVKHGHLGDHPEPDPVKVAKMLGARSVEGVGKVMARF